MSRPSPGDRILIFKQGWLSLIMSGQKTLEIRGSALRPGRYYLGCKGQIYGVAEFGEPVRIATLSEWVALKGKHLVDTVTLPYKRTHASPLLRVTALRPHTYIHPRGAIGIVVHW